MYLVYIELELQAQNKIHSYTSCHSVPTARQSLSLRVISLGSFTGAGDLVLRLVCVKTLYMYKRATCNHAVAVSS